MNILIRRVAPKSNFFVCVLAAAPTLSCAASLYVDAYSGSASDSGPGSAAIPFRTLTRAASMLQPGDTLIIGPGTYRESLTFPKRNWSSDTTTTVQGDPGGRTLLKGSRVMASWTQVATDRFVRVVSEEPQQIHLQGKPLTQVAGTVFGGYPDTPGHSLSTVLSTNGGIWPGRIVGDRSTMPPGSFHFDKQSKTVMIRTLPGQAFPGLAEVSTASRVISGNGLNNLVIRDLNVEHSNTTLNSRGGAIHLEGSSIQIERVTVRNADGACISAIGNNITISSGKFQNCGQLGILGRGKKWVISDSEFSKNNTRGFNKWWEAGGAKFVGDGGLQDSVLTRVSATENNGDGIWFDWMNAGNRVTNSYAAFNAGFGIHTEVVEHTLIDNNVVVGNTQRGIYHRQGSSNTFAFNFVSHNGLDGIAVVDEGQRVAGSAFDFSVKDNWIVGNMIAWNNPGLSVPAPLADNISNLNYFIGDAAATRIRIGWGAYMSRAAWKTAGLDTQSLWRDYTSTVKPVIVPTSALKPQLVWAQKLRSSSAPFSSELIDRLELREVGLLGRTDWRAGPDTTTWFGP